MYLKQGERFSDVIEGKVPFTKEIENILETGNDKLSVLEAKEEAAKISNNKEMLDDVLKEKEKIKTDTQKEYNKANMKKTSVWDEFINESMDTDVITPQEEVNDRIKKCS